MFHDFWEIKWNILITSENMQELSNKISSKYHLTAHF